MSLRGAKRRGNLTNNLTDYHSKQVCFTMTKRNKD